MSGITNTGILDTRCVINIFSPDTQKSKTFEYPLRIVTYMWFLDYIAWKICPERFFMFKVFIIETLEKFDKITFVKLMPRFRFLAPDCRVTTVVTWLAFNFIPLNSPSSVIASLHCINAIVSPVSSGLDCCYRHWGFSNLLKRQSHLQR